MQMKTLISAFFALNLLSACLPTDREAGSTLGASSRLSSDRVAARINGTEIFRSDIDLSAQEQGFIDEGLTLGKNDPRYEQVLEDLIDQRLLALDAESQGLGSEREAKIRLATARERILGNIRLERHLRETVNETTIRRMYEEQSKLVARGNEVRARHILVEEKAKAEDLLKTLEAGGDFGELAKQHSMDKGSAERGGDLGYFTQDMLNTQFTRPVFKAAKGDRLGPLKSEFGWHIAEILDQRPAAQESFETLKPKIANFMTFDSIQNLLTDLRSTAEVVILEDQEQVPEQVNNMNSQPDTGKTPASNEMPKNE